MKENTYLGRAFVRINLLCKCKCDGGGGGVSVARADLGEGLWLAFYNSLWFGGRRSWPAPRHQIRADGEG